MKKARKRRAPFHTALKAALQRPQGKRAMKLYRRFWGLRKPASLRAIADGNNAVYVSLGRSPGITIADGPYHRHRHKKRHRMSGLLLTNPAGTRLWILRDFKRGLAKGGKRKLLGYVAQTEYIPTTGMEKMGTWKKNATWCHEHHEGGGRWPRVYRDAHGNLVYARSTLRVGKWLRR